MSNNEYFIVSMEESVYNAETGQCLDIDNLRYEETTCQTWNEVKRYMTTKCPEISPPPDEYDYFFSNESDCDCMGTPAIRTTNFYICRIGANKSSIKFQKVLPEPVFIRPQILFVFN